VHAGNSGAGSAGQAARGGNTGSAGTLGVAGTSNSAGAGAGGSPVTAPQFKLLWRDEFDNFDTGRWQKANHDFPENAAQFTPDNAVVEGGFLKLRITNTPNNGHAYSAAEVYTNDSFTFGRFEARIRFAPGSGIVSSLFTYRDDANHGWNEIDIENLGYITDGVQYNLISSPLGGGALTYQPKVVPTGFSPTADFHDYAIEWTPVDIRFYVDEKLAWRDVQTRINQACRLRMNIWPTNNAKTTFAGPLDPSKIPAEAQYDWVAVYAYQP
jgi:beta-glucanase (GH16 family)